MEESTRDSGSLLLSAAAGTPWLLYLATGIGAAVATWLCLRGLVRATARRSRRDRSERIEQLIAEALSTRVSAPPAEIIAVLRDRSSHPSLHRRLCDELTGCVAKYRQTSDASSGTSRYLFQTTAVESSSGRCTFPRGCRVVSP